MKTIFKVFAGLTLFGALAIGGCALLVGKGVEDATKESDKAAITEKQFRSVKIGDRKSSVLKELGKPADKDSVEFEVPEIDGSSSTSRTDCVYYNRKGELLSGYQLCFTDGRLESKIGV